MKFASLVLLSAILSPLFAVPGFADTPDESDDPLGACRLRPHHAIPPPGCTHSVVELVGDTVMPQHPTLPDLDPVPAFFVDIGPAPTDDGVPLVDLNRPPSGPSFLRFTTVIANRGDFALEILGRPTTDPDRAEAHQCLTWDPDRVCRRRVAVGDMTFHPQHNHFHFDDFAAYELRELLPDGTPDFSPNGLLAASPKVSFCLQDSRRERADAPPQFYRACLGALQGISPGWSDVYGHTLAGQMLPVSAIADGTYALVFVADPSDLLHESDETNNLAWATVEIFANRTQARVVSG